MRKLDLAKAFFFPAPFFDGSLFYTKNQQSYNTINFKSLYIDHLICTHFSGLCFTFIRNKLPQMIVLTLIVRHVCFICCGNHEERIFKDFTRRSAPSLPQNSRVSTSQIIANEPSRAKTRGGRGGSIIEPCVLRKKYRVFVR